MIVFSFSKCTTPSEMCMPPSPPSQPVVMAVSDTELALSWQPGESEGSSSVLHFLVAYIRSVMNDWSASRNPIDEALHSLKLVSLRNHWSFFNRCCIDTYSCIEHKHFHRSPPQVIHGSNLNINLKMIGKY